MKKKTKKTRHWKLTTTHIPSGHFVKRVKNYHTMIAHKVGSTKPY